MRTRQHYDRVNRHIAYLFNRLRISPKSSIGQALACAAWQWPHPEPCFHAGQIALDNNLTENPIRPTNLGHKNWMIISGEHTGWRSSVIDTILEQLRRHGADPFI